MKKYLKRIPLYMVAISAGLYIVFFFTQASLIFVPNNQMIATPSENDWGYDEILLAVDGESTVLWFIPLEGARRTVLYSHGNDSNISTCLGVAKLFRSLGFSVALYDYGGYGKSTGAPSEQRLYADAVAAWEYLTEERELDPASILLWGPSFGGGPTCELATRVKPGGVVLENAFTSMSDAAFKDYPWFPGWLFIRHRFDNEAKMPRIHAPVLVIHSQGDMLYPYSQGKRLFEAANDPKQFLEVFGDHGEGAQVSREIFVKGVERFLGTISSFKTMNTVGTAESKPEGPPSG